MKNVVYSLVCLFLIIQLLADESPYAKAIFDGAKDLAQVITIVENQYVQEIDPQKCMQDAAAAFVKGLDPHSTRLDAKAYQEIIQSTKGELCGIGIVVDNTKEEDDEFLRVLDTVPAGPADIVGIKSGDKILSVDDQSVRGMTLEETIARLKGKPKTKVDVKVQRGEKFLDFTIERDIVKEPNALCYVATDHDMYYICLNMFTQNSVTQMENILKKIQGQSSKGLIIDLRSNSGGLLNAVIDILGLFVGKNKLVVSTKGKLPQDQEQYFTTRDAITLNTQIPIMVIVNNFTASAAEILAGCLQYYAQQNIQGMPPVFVVGTKTFGKGSVQEVIPLGDDTALKLTTRLYYLPNGLPLQGTGVVPDFHIEPKVAPSADVAWFNKTFGRESELKNSIYVDPETKHITKKDKKTKKEKVDKKKEQEKNWHEKKKELIATDHVILTTVRLLEFIRFIQANKPHISRKDLIDTVQKKFTPEDKLIIQEVAIS